MYITANELSHTDKVGVMALDFDDDFDDDDWRSGNYTLHDMLITMTEDSAYREALIAERKASQDYAVQQFYTYGFVGCCITVRLWPIE